MHYDNISELSNSVKEGNGVFFLSGHFANWELMAFSFPSLSGHSLNIITKKQASKKLNTLINKYRALSGNKLIETGMTLKEAIRVVKKKEPVCFLVDQAGHPDYSVYTRFFGKDVASFGGPAKLALSDRPALFFTYIVRSPDFIYTVYSRRINYDHIPDRSKESVEELSQIIQRELEKTIVDFPEQWLWFHKRFKHSR